MSNQSVFVKTLIVVGTLFGLYALFQMRYLITILFVAILFASTIRPIVSVLERRGLPPGASILLVYLVTLLGLGSVISFILPSIIARFFELVNSESQIIQTTLSVWRQVSLMAWNQFTVSLPTINENDVAVRIQQARELASQRLVELWPLTFESLSNLVLLFTMAFYWLTERDRLERLGLRMVPSRHRERFHTIFCEIEYTLGAYVRGQGVMIITVGFFSFAGLTLLGIPYVPLLAAFAGLMEAIPIVGPVIGAVPALIVTAITAPEKIIFVLFLYVLIQQIESAVLVPKVMERQVGLRPLIVILALAAGNLLGGLTGALLAISLTAALQILTRELIIEPTVQANQPVKVEGAVLVGEPMPPTPSATVETASKSTVEVAPHTPS